MNGDRDLHNALKTEIVKQSSTGPGNVALLKQQWGKDDIAYSFHFWPNTLSLSNLSEADYLAHLGLTHSHCSVLPAGECMCMRVGESFDLDAFIPTFSASFQAFKGAIGHFEKCGIHILPRGRSGISSGSLIQRGLWRGNSSGDGHTAGKREEMKKAEDDNYFFRFTWIDGDQQKGWTTHYRPKNFPLTPEIANVFNFLGLEKFPQCPEFDFEECYWRFTPFESREDSFFDTNANHAHALFDANPTNFSSGIEKLLNAHTLLEPFGMGFLPLVRDIISRTQQDILGNIHKATKAETPKKDYDFEVALSFAGTERSVAEELATKLKDTGIDVFYDNFYPDQLWGKNLVEFFDEIYRKKSRYCVMFVSKEYASRMWTIHERKSAQARQLEEKGVDYILPIRVDETELPGLPNTVGYLPIRDYPVPKIAEILKKKLNK